MKKCLCIIILSLFASTLFAQITLSDFKKQFKDKSITEIKTILVDQNKEVEKLLKLSSLSIKITPGNVSHNETKTTEKFSTSPKDKISKAFNNKLNQLYFAQHIIYPNTVLGIDYSMSSLIYSLQDYRDYKFPEPTITLKKVYFKDGKTTDLTQKIMGRDGDLNDEIKGTKWIDSIQLEASYYYPEQMSFVNISAKNPSHILNNGKIILTAINGNEIDVQLTEKVKEEIIKVEGINASGNSVEQSGSSSSSMTSNYSPDFLRKLYEAVEETIVKIDKKAYKNADELLEDLYEKTPKEDKEKPENLTNASYSFRGNIVGVNIFFKPKGALQNYSFTLKNKAEYVEGFTIAQNKKRIIRPYRREF